MSVLYDRIRMTIEIIGDEFKRKNKLFLKRNIVADSLKSPAEKALRDFPLTPKADKL
jgi:hypothetical protein